MSKIWKISDLNPDEPIRQSLKEILFYWIRKMLSYSSSAVEGKDVEALHDMRTAALRIRALLKLHQEHFPKKALREHRKDIKRLIDSMGKAREIDVFQSELTELIPNVPLKDRIALNWLLAQQETHREIRRAAMKKEIRVLQSAGCWKRLEQFAEDFASTKKNEAQSAGEASLKSSGREVIPPLVDSFLAGIDLTCENEAHPEFLHTMRLQGKRLRYAMEMYLPAYGASFAQHLDSVKEVLSVMGRIHDLDVNLPILKKHVQLIDCYNAITNERSCRIAKASINKLIGRFEGERHERFLCLCLELSRWKAGAFRRRFIESLKPGN